MPSSIYNKKIQIGVQNNDVHNVDSSHRPLTFDKCLYKYCLFCLTENAIKFNRMQFSAWSSGQCPCLYRPDVRSSNLGPGRPPTV